MKKYKTDFKHDLLQDMHRLVGDFITSVIVADDADKLWLAALAEVKEKMYLKMAVVKKEYTISLTPVQAIAFKMMCDEMLLEVGTHMGNKMLLCSNEIDQLYTNHTTNNNDSINSNTDQHVLPVPSV